MKPLTQNITVIFQIRDNNNEFSEPVQLGFIVCESRLLPGLQPLTLAPRSEVKGHDHCLPLQRGNSQNPNIEQKV